MVTTERVAMEFRILSSRIGADQLPFSKASHRPRNGEPALARRADREILSDPKRFREAFAAAVNQYLDRARNMAMPGAGLKDMKDQR